MKRAFNIIWSLFVFAKSEDVIENGGYASYNSNIDHLSSAQTINGKLLVGTFYRKSEKASFLLKIL